MSDLSLTAPALRTETGINNLIIRPPVTNQVTPTTITQNSPTKLEIKEKMTEGKASPTISFLENIVPQWPEKTKKAIASDFSQGLKTYKTTPAELTEILKNNNLGNLEINIDNIQNSANADEIKKIQEQLSKKFNNNELKKLGIANNITPDGIFGKKTISLLLALKDTQRGEPVNIDVKNIKQSTNTGCFKTAEAMLFNFLHKKDSTDDSYSELDARARIKEEDRGYTSVMVGVTSEDEKGRITFPKNMGIKLINSIDDELNKKPPMPIITGVSNKKQEAGQEYNEGITDHFILITGKGYDENGLFYSFNDPAGGGQGKLRYDPITAKLSGKGDMANVYDVTMVSFYKNTPETTERYAQIGKPIYKLGDEKPEISTLKIKLNSLGFKISQMDSIYTSKTADIVKQFQKSNNLPETGIIDSFTKKSLETNFNKFQIDNPGQIMFKTGDKFPKIIDFQKKLTQLGFIIKPQTGYYAATTEKAVADLQKSHKIEPTGKIDNQTWAKIEELSKK